MRTADLQLEYWQCSGWFEYYLDATVDGHHRRAHQAAGERLLDRFRKYGPMYVGLWVADNVWVWDEDQ
jgi:hypothetical protein